MNSGWHVQTFQTVLLNMLYKIQNASKNPLQVFCFILMYENLLFLNLQKKNIVHNIINEKEVI